jgi:DNA-binding MarR family transcriptional regulator
LLSRVSELAEKLGITRQAVSQLVDDLEQLGAVTRIPDREDKRAKRVVFTVEGKRSIIDGLAHLESLEPALEEILGERLMQSFRKALLMLHDHLTR